MSIGFEKNDWMLAVGKKPWSYIGTEVRRKEVVSQIMDIYETKEDLLNFKGTKWGICNAVADFASNSKPARLTERAFENRLNSFFDGNYLLNAAEKALA